MRGTQLTSTMRGKGVLKTHQKQKKAEHPNAQHAVHRSKGQRCLAPIAAAMRYLLQLPANDPKLTRLAACAQLIGLHGRRPSPSTWSCPEMEVACSEAKALESAWRSFSCGSDALVQVADTSAVLCLVFREMGAAVQQDLPMPEHDELMRSVAHTLLGRRFSSIRDLEQAVDGMLAPDDNKPLHSAQLAACVLANVQEAATPSVGLAAVHIASFLS